MPVTITLSDPTLIATCEFFLLPERNGWTAEVCLNQKLFFMIDRAESGEWQLDFCAEAKDRFADRIASAVVIELIEKAQRTLAERDFSHFDIDTLRLN